MNKYDLLQGFLASTASHITQQVLTFSQIEQIIQAELPPSAHNHRPWWANPASLRDHPYAQAWLAVGWKVATVDLSEQWVCFQRKP